MGMERREWYSRKGKELVMKREKREKHDRKSKERVMRMKTNG